MCVCEIHWWSMTSFRLVLGGYEMRKPYMSYFRTSQALFNFHNLFLCSSEPLNIYLMKCNRECVRIGMKLTKAEKNQ